MFGILANGLFYYKDNLNDDWFLETKKKAQTKGTRVSMALHFDSERSLNTLLPRLQAETGFAGATDTAQVRIALGRFEEEPYVSRLQAQRLLKGMEQYRRVVLDFSGIATVGRAFVDEVFRVYASENPGVGLDVIHANEDVRFMIRQGMPELQGAGADR